ncbi:MAG: MotA/TolQ/ExbB proton channel family protein [Planctomycetaceae bacterium]|nr:MAG: MotA/TolQ/ExbB proton channel family protein [Planctomycetaceae bacterium]
MPEGNLTFRPVRSRILPLAVLGCLFAWLAIFGALGGVGGVTSASGQDTEETLVDPDLSSWTTPSAVPQRHEPRRRTLLDTVRDGGLVGLLILLLSMVSVGFMIEHSLTIRKTVLMPEPVIQQLDKLIEQGQVDEAIAACQASENDSLVASVVLVGLERYRGSEYGFAEYKAAVEEAGEDQTGRLYRKTEVLGLIGAIAPMLGLTGTVLGMIQAFNTIAVSGGTAKPDELAGGIGQALVTTLMGLVVAMPTMVAFSYFRNRIDSLVAEAGKRVEQIMMPLGRRR